MKKFYRLDGLDCANCAAKMEKAINDLTEVSSATVNFMTTKLTIEADGDFAELLPKVEKSSRKSNPGLKSNRSEEALTIRKRLLLIF